jgi:tetratricopeptide (TPR) repeat protein
MADNLQRLDGWKAIAAHFRRNRSTVMRWAESGDFPVHRIAGRKGASVWAYAHELDAWLSGHAGEEPPKAPVHEVAASTAAHARRPIAGWVIAGVCAALAAVVVALATVGPHSIRASGAHRQALPSDPAVADLYLRARYDWSTRSPAGLHKAMAEFAAVTSRDPTFAPAYAGLADVYIASREYDAMPDSVAFPKAEAAAKAALAVDPLSADANQALGFIDFWSRHDLRAARAHFDRSLKVDPNNAQTHFWLGNILSDVGEDRDALRELRIARQLDPGSKAIAADYAWAQWCAGPGDAGFTELQELADHGSPLATPHTFLAFIYLAKGEIPSYLDEKVKLATLENSPALTAQVAAERAAFTRYGPQGVLELIASRATSGDSMQTSAEWAATAASLLGRRDRLLELLANARAARESWSLWRADERRFTRWRADPAIMEGLAHVRAVHRDATGVTKASR